MRAVVVALGKVGLPLAAQIASAGHEVVGCDVDPRVVELVNAGKPPFPNEAGPRGGADRARSSSGRLRAQTDTTAAVAEGPDLVVAVPPLYVDDRAEPDWAILDAVTADIARGPAGRARRSASRRRCRWGRRASGSRPALERGQRAARGGGLLHVVFSPERVFSGRVLADLETYPKLVGGLERGGRAARRRAVRRVHRRRRCAGWGRPRRRRWPSSPRPRTAT